MAKLFLIALIPFFIALFATHNAMAQDSKFSIDSAAKGKMQKMEFGSFKTDKQKKKKDKLAEDDMRKNNEKHSTLKKEHSKSTIHTVFDVDQGSGDEYNSGGVHTVFDKNRGSKNSSQGVHTVFDKKTPAPPL